MEGLTVSAAAARTGWSARMLRYLEQHGLVLPRRTEAGYRLYGLGELNQLNALRALRTRFGVGLEEVESFGKFLGGSAANVAVAAARLGNRTALISGVGDDPFGRFVRRELGRFGVDDRYVREVAELPTPVTFCEIFPPDNFPLYFYRFPKAPDLEIRSEELDLEAIRAARVFWVTVTGLSQELTGHLHTFAAKVFIDAIAEELAKAILKFELVHTYFLGYFPDEEMITDVLPDHIPGGLNAVYFVVIVVAGG